jgi:hypothetical protein
MPAPTSSSIIPQPPLSSSACRAGKGLNHIEQTKEHEGTNKIYEIMWNKQQRDPHSNDFIDHDGLGIFDPLDFFHAA